jgi:siroheme synthase
LLDAGLPSSTPAAVISNGSLPNQRQVVAPLCELATTAANVGLSSPALIVVGEVVTLQAQLLPSPRGSLRDAARSHATAEPLAALAEVLARVG